MRRTSSESEMSKESHVKMAAATQRAQEDARIMDPKGKGAVDVESEYMDELVKVASAAGGRVLEIGYGMGITARQFVGHGKIVQHVVCEPNQSVFKQALKHAHAVADRVAFNPLFGFWQEITPGLRSGSFDAILYDTFPDPVDAGFFGEARRLLRPGGTLTFVWSRCGSEDPAASRGIECDNWQKAIDLMANATSNPWLPEELGSPEARMPKEVVLDVFQPCSADNHWHCPASKRTFLVPNVVKKRSNDKDGKEKEGAGGDGYDPPSNRTEVDEQTVQLRKNNPHANVRYTNTYYPHAKAAAVAGVATVSTRASWQQAELWALRAELKGEKPGMDALVIHGHIVMDTEESEYMKDLAKLIATEPRPPAAKRGRTLEVGFGMGISARAIQSQNVSEHVIIEANVKVMEQLIDTFAGEGLKGGSIRPLLGFWQEILPTLEDDSFDAILFDPFPNDDMQILQGVVHQLIFMEHAHRVLKPGGVYTYMSGECDEDVIARDKNVILAAGFMPENVQLRCALYPMVQHCPTYPKCEEEDRSVTIAVLHK